MLRSTFYSFTTAFQGLKTAQTQLDVTGQNISNVSTTGYTRQRADTYASSPIDNNLVGQGSVVSGISQIRDSTLDTRFRTASCSAGEEDAKLAGLEDLELVFDEIEDSGLMTAFSDFLSTLQTYKSSDDSFVRSAASTIVNQLNQYASLVSSVRESQESTLSEGTVTSINDILTDISDLNDSIKEEELSGNSALELKDERNLLLDELATYIDIDVDYDTVELTNSVTYDDVHISMIGADGAKTELVYNGTAATLSATLPDENDATAPDEAVVTIDNSDIQALQILETVNKSINNISSLNKKLSTNATKMATVTTDLATSTADLTAAQTAAGTATGEDLIALEKTIANLQTKITDLGKTQTKLTESNTTLLASRTTNEESLTAKFNTLGIQVVAADTDADTSTVADYSITLKDSTGTAILNADGTTMTLVSGTTGTRMSKDSLIQAGITFESTTANEQQSAGSLKGALDLLNSEGTFDYDNNESRGIGYYENMLDTLANKFAEAFNTLNSTTITTNADGSVTYDVPLFETSDGTKTITAKNISVADDWLSGKTKLTASKDTSLAGSTSGDTSNILLMIEQYSADYTFTTNTIIDTDSYGNYLSKNKDANGDVQIFANGTDSDGNYTLDGVKVANSKFVDIIDITENSGTYYDSSGTAIANGIDSDGDYTVIIADSALNEYNADGTTTGSTIAAPTDNLDGTYTDSSGRILTKDTSGNYVLKVANSEGVPYESDGETLSTTSSMAARQGSSLYTGSFAEFLENIDNVLALDIKTTTNLLTTSTTILEDIQDSKDSISSVSIDEEGINMMQYQKAYNAAARMMTTLDEAVARIIDQMGTVGT